MAKGITEFRQDVCKGCELCANVCPKNCLELEKEHTNSHGYHPIHNAKPDECVGCGSCALMCPDGVISVYMEE